MAAEFKTHRPTVDDEPSATTLSRAPDFSRVSVRGSLTPIEMVELAARQVSAGAGLSCARTEVELDPEIGITSERPNTQVIRRIEVDQRACRRPAKSGAISGMASQILSGALVISPVPNIVAEQERSDRV